MDPFSKTNCIRKLNIVLAVLVVVSPNNTKFYNTKHYPKTFSNFLKYPRRIVKVIWMTCMCQTRSEVIKLSAAYSNFHISVVKNIFDRIKHVVQSEEHPSANLVDWRKTMGTNRGSGLQIFYPKVS